MVENKPVFTFQKNVDRNTSKIIIPKFIVDQWGATYVMEVYDSYIVLRPVKKED